MEIFMPDTQLLVLECMTEIERHLANGWSWGVMAKLLSRKWGVAFSSAELQAHYMRTKKQLEMEEMEKRRQKITYYSAFWE